MVAPGDAGENAYGVCDFRCYNRLNESTLPARELCTLPVRCRPHPRTDPRVKVLYTCHEVSAQVLANSPRPRNANTMALLGF